MNIINTTRCLVAFLLFANVATAQINSRYSIGFNAGTFIYNGDLSPWRTGSWKTPAFVLGFTGHKILSSHLAARVEFNFGKLRGDEAKYTQPEYRQYRALAFTTRVRELVVAAEYTPLAERRLSPYAFGGIGYAGLKVQRDYSRFNGEYFSATEPTLIENLQKDIDNGVPRSTLIFPVGVGLKYRLNPTFSLHGEAAQRITATDYLDGFSQAGNPNKRDSYTKYSIGLRYHIGTKDKYDCPTIRY